MTPQSQFMVTAPIARGRESELRALLATLNEAPGRVKSDNPLVPFASFARLHVARFIVLDDPTVADITVYGLNPPELPTYLVFLGDCDGDGDDFLADAAVRAEVGLRKIFSHCEGLAAETNLLQWMRARNTIAAAAYTNWIGRTVSQVQQERALHDALRAEMRRDQNKFGGADPQSLRKLLKDFVDSEQRAGRLPIDREKPTPFGWWLRNFAHLILVPLGLLLLAPFLLIASPVLIVMLRRRETHDPEIVPRPMASHVQRLSVLEDHDVTNQFSAIGVLKPGLFRRYATILFLLGLDYAARHVYKRGHLTRVRTIHFARWVFLDDKQRIYFASNYDGSLESYMDDFINKVGWGLNLVFSNGLGYPRTNWLIKQGCAHEQHFKYFLRRHQRPTDVWYKAYPGLTAIDLDRNTRIREGLERKSMTDAEALAWSRLL